MAAKALMQIAREHPYLEDFFSSIGLQIPPGNLTVLSFLDGLSDDKLEDCGMSRAQIAGHLAALLQKMTNLNRKSRIAVQDITIIGGRDKFGKPEKIELSMKPGEIICIVGPTGSGKSRLLADIECLAQKDTPTGRQVLLDGKIPSQEIRFSIEHKLVAQLSQNMNFIMDLSVGDFISMHAESRMIAKADRMVETIVGVANDLAGEKFAMSTPVTALSGGQSRALMIADTALLSASPIVLIDEIENAGVDRRKALDLLVKEEKIVLMSTHEPILALMGDKRIVIKNGGMSRIMETSSPERSNLEFLQLLDARLAELRNRLRTGERIDFDIRPFFTD